jgi:hypothetical protein
MDTDKQPFIGRKPRVMDEFRGTAQPSRRKKHTPPLSSIAEETEEQIAEEKAFNRKRTRKEKNKAPKHKLLSAFSPRDQLRIRALHEGSSIAISKSPPRGRFVDMVFRMKEARAKMQNGM